MTLGVWGAEIFAIYDKVDQESASHSEHQGKMTDYSPVNYNDELYKQKKLYEKYIDTNAEIEIAEKKFVFTGFGVLSSGDLKSLPLVQEVEKKGGLIRKSISGVTDYLVVKNIANAGTTKLQDAVTQMNAGKPIRIITEESLKNALQGKTKTTQQLNKHDLQILL